MLSEYIAQTSELEKKVITVLAEEGPKCGYDFHLGGKRKRGHRKALMSNSYWEKVRKHLGPKGLGFIKPVQLRRHHSQDQRGRRKDLYWLTDKGVVYALALNVKSGLLFKNTKKLYPDIPLLHAIFELKKVLGEKAFNFCLNEVLKLEDFSEQTLQRLVSKVKIYGFMKARELSPERNAYTLKEQIEKVIKGYPELHKLDKALSKKIKRDLDILFSS